MRNILLFSLLVLAGCCSTLCDSNKNHGDAFDLTAMYSQYIDEWKSEAKTAFNEAESKIFVNTPKPDVIIGPDKDPNKCVCKGTGIIIQGDGHKTVCPFHGNSTYKR